MKRSADIQMLMSMLRGLGVKCADCVHHRVQLNHDPCLSCADGYGRTGRADGFMWTEAALERLIGECDEDDGQRHKVDG